MINTSIQPALRVGEKENRPVSQEPGSASDPFIPFIQAVGRGERLKRDLDYQEARAAIDLIMHREASDAQVGAFLIAQRVKGESVDEIRGFTDRLRAEFVHPISPRVADLLDLAVPYDGKAKTAQLAPAIAVTLAEAGVPVLLHGAEGVPTKYGVGPGAVFAELGVAADLTTDRVEGQLEKIGFAYVDVQNFAPAWHELMPLRRQFGLRTVLNTVEKFLNPAAAPFQISGFYHANYIKRIQSAQSGTRHSWMVQGEEGSVEMAAGRRTPIFGQEPMSELIVDPTTVGLDRRVRIDLAPDLRDHARVNEAVLAAQPSPASDQVALTVATILHLLGVAADLADGLTRARQILLSGAALRRLNRARSI